MSEPQGLAPGYEAAGPLPPAEIERTLTRRRRVGYGLAVLCFAAVTALVVCSLRLLHGMEVPASSEARRFEIARMAAHAVISVATLYFIYQALKIAERMIFPHWWASRSPALMKALLGVTDPLDLSSKTLAQTADLLQKLKPFQDWMPDRK